MSGPSHTTLNVSALALSAGVALLLVVVKLWAWAMTGALSVAASLADSGLDLMVSIAGLTAVIYAARPPDEDHAFGHSSAEDLAALGQALFLMVSAAAIAVAAIWRLLDEAPPPLEETGTGMAIMALSIALTLGLVLWQTRVARRTGSRVVAADRLHYLGDLVPNIGAILSLWAASFGLASLDSVVALGAAGMLAVGAGRIGLGAVNALMDRSADPAMIEGIERIAADFPGVEGFHDLKTRTAGSRVFVNIHIELDGSQSLHDAHAIGAALRRAILRAYPQADVIIHKDPVRES